MNFGYLHSFNKNVYLQKPHLKSKFDGKDIHMFGKWKMELLMLQLSEITDFLNFLHDV